MSFYVAVVDLDIQISYIILKKFIIDCIIVRVGKKDTVAQ